MKCKVYTSAIESRPPTSDCLDDIKRMEAMAIARKLQVSDGRTAVQISTTTFVLCDPGEETSIKRYMQRLK